MTIETFDLLGVLKIKCPILWIGHSLFLIFKKHHIDFSGRKYRGEHPNNLDSSFKCWRLYFARKFGLSICPIKPVDKFKWMAISSWVRFFSSLIFFTWSITYWSILLFALFFAIVTQGMKRTIQALLYRYRNFYYIAYRTLRTLHKRIEAFAWSPAFKT